ASVGPARLANIGPAGLANIGPAGAAEVSALSATARDWVAGPITSANLAAARQWPVAAASRKLRGNSARQSAASQSRTAGGKLRDAALLQEVGCCAAWTSRAAGPDSACSGTGNIEEVAELARGGPATSQIATCTAGPLPSTRASWQAAARASA